MDKETVKVKVNVTLYISDSKTIELLVTNNQRNYEFKPNELKKVTLVYDIDSSIDDINKLNLIIYSHFSSQDYFGITVSK